MSTNHVTISTPRVHTMQVTVRALRIGTKQVTQSVFRQLPKRSVWDDETGQFQGTPWGLVNYFWNDCSYSSGTHLHVVWQDGERLFRDCVFGPKHHIPAGVAQANDAIDAAQKRCLRAAALLHGLAWIERGYEGRAITAPEILRVKWPCGIETRLNWKKMREHVFDLHAQDLGYHLYEYIDKLQPQRHDYRKSQNERVRQTPRPAGEGWREWSREGSGDWHRSVEESDSQWQTRAAQEIGTLNAQLRTAVFEEIAEEWDDFTIPSTLEQAKHALNPMAQACLTTQQYYNKLVQTFDAAYESLQALDQLFIAV